MPLEDTRNKYAGVQAQQKELLTLGELTGIRTDPAVYRIIIELLGMQVEPEAIYKLLRYIRRSSKPSRQNSKQSLLSSSSTTVRSTGSSESKF